VLVALLATVAFWALNVIVVKWAVGQSGEWDPLSYSFIRLAIGAALLAAFVKLREGSIGVQRRDVPVILFSALVGIVVNQLGFMYAATYATATTISLVLATIPAFAAITASVLGHERIGGRHWLGIGVAAVGTVLVLQAGPGDLDFTSLRGDLLALLAAASWGVYSALVRPLMDRYSPNRISTVVVCAALPMLAVVSLPQVVAQDYGAVTLGGWAALVYSVFFSLVVTNVLWFGAIQRGGAARATAVLPIQPFLGALFAFVLLGETVTPLQIVGGLVVVVGIWLTRRRTLVLAD
jgi:drug/metabolite transporter (DMT)-like permease